ncbi:unnamed protein product [Rhizophagus irregularis]|nr:unnamed protein product [Rhizophagus irregularis]
MTSFFGNEEIDNFIQERQLNINSSNNVVFEWIPYNQFNEIKETGKNGSITVYSEIWKNGPLHKGNWLSNKYTRDSNKEVTLNCLYNLQNPVDSLINEAKKYSTKNKFLVLYGLSQNPVTNDYILVLTRTSGNEKIDDFIYKMQFKINDSSDTALEWIPYTQFYEINIAGNGGFAKVYSAKWKDGPLYLKNQSRKYGKRDPNKRVALKCLNDSQDHITKLLNEVNAYSTKPIYNSILKVYGISQDPNTKDYIIVLHYAKDGNFDNWISINDNFKYFNWKEKIQKLNSIVKELKEIHENQMIHHDFHTGNILFDDPIIETYVYISDMGLCGEVGNADKTKIYGVMPYVAPEVLRGKPYTQAADIYSLGMIMYYIATERQPFSDCAHDNTLALNICNDIRPKINEQEAPNCYINLMKKCWDQNPDKRPDANQLLKSLLSISTDNLYKAEIEEAENYRILHLPSSKEDRQVNTHPQAIYTSRLLNPFTKDLNSECLDCAI